MEVLEVIITNFLNESLMLYIYVARHNSFIKPIII